MQTWVELVKTLNKNKITFKLSQAESCNAFYARQSCLGANVLRGENQKPFNSRLKYKYLVFLNGNLIFTPKQFMSLYNLIQEKSLSFLSPYIKDRQTGYYDRKLSGDVLLGRVEYTEFDMVIIKNGVIEKLKYPWFEPHKSKNSFEVTSIDRRICEKLRSVGVSLSVDYNIQPQLNKS